MHMVELGAQPLQHRAASFLEQCKSVVGSEELHEMLIAEGGARAAGVPKLRARKSKQFLLLLRRHMLQLELRLLLPKVLACTRQ